MGTVAALPGGREDRSREGGARESGGTEVSRRQPAGTQADLRGVVVSSERGERSRWTTHHPLVLEMMTKAEPGEAAKEGERGYGDEVSTSRVESSMNKKTITKSVLSPTVTSNSSLRKKSEISILLSLTSQASSKSKKRERRTHSLSAKYG